MLPRNQRLSGNRITILLKKGFRKDHQYFTAKYLSTTKPFSRFCIVVSTKIEPKAVRRNLIRRQLYEAIRLQQNILNAGWDIVLIIKPALTGFQYQEKAKIIHQLFQTLKK